MTAYYVGDTPAEDMVIEPARNGEPMDLAPFNDVDIVFTDPDGEVVVSPGFLGTIDDDTVVVEWPGTTVLEVPGMHALTITLTGAGGVEEQLAPVYVIVQGDDGWHTLDSIREEWPDAAQVEDRQLHELLWVAQSAVEAYAPTFTGRPPTDYRKAQAMQARNVWNSSAVAPSGEVGAEGFVIRPFPLDWQIRQLLRPKRGIPVVG